MLTASQIERITSLWVPDEWPAFADSYVIGCHQHPFRYYVERIRHLGLSGGVLIDAGCGSGRWSFPLATTFDRVIGFDYTPRRLESALWLKHRFDVPSIDFIEGDIRKIPANDASADAIYRNSVAVGDIPIEAILDECFRVLKPGGICYVGLNGPGYSIELTKRADPNLADFGHRRIYYTHCQRHLGALVTSIVPRGALNARARESLARGVTPAALLADLGARTDQVLAAETIATDFAAEFTQTLLDDLAAITGGQRVRFSHSETGRDFEPEEMRVAARKVGFDRFEWALDGWLSLGPDGAVSKGPSPKAKPGTVEFEGRVRVFEMLMWKPLTGAPAGLGG